MSAPRIAIAAALVLAVTDVAWSTASQFWVDHALFAGLVSGALLLLITVLVVDEVVEAREQRRSRDVAHELGGMLARQAQRVVSDARAELAAMRKERDEERRAAKAAEEEAREKARRSRTLRQRVEEALSFGEWAGPMDPLTIGALKALGVYMEIQASRATQRELIEVLERRTAEFESGLATAVPFLAPREAGRECLGAGFDLVERLHEAGRSASIEAAEENLAGDMVNTALTRFRRLASQLGKA